MNATSQPLKTIPAPPAVETTPPDTPPMEPRTEPFDWLFVSWRRTDAAPVRNAPARDMRITDAAELERTVAQFLVRDAAHERYPYIFLAPALAPAFIERVRAALVTQGATVTPKDVAALLLTAEHMPGWGIVLCGYPHESKGGDKTHRAAGGAREFVERPVYDELSAAHAETLDELDALENPSIPVLPERERGIVAQVLAHVKTAALGAKEDGTYAEGRVSDWLPSEAVVSMWLARERGDAAQAVAVTEEPAPDPKLAEQLNTVIWKYFQDKGHGPSRKTIGQKCTARDQNVTANLKWLTRPGGPIVLRRGAGKRADEYLPADDA